MNKDNRVKAIETSLLHINVTSDDKIDFFHIHSYNSQKIKILSYYFGDAEKIIVLN